MQFRRRKGLRPSNDGPERLATRSLVTPSPVSSPVSEPATPASDAAVEVEETLTVHAIAGGQMARRQSLHGQMLSQAVIITRPGGASTTPYQREIELPADPVAADRLRRDAEVVFGLAARAAAAVDDARLSRNHLASAKPRHAGWYATLWASLVGCLRR